MLEWIYSVKSKLDAAQIVVLILCLVTCASFVMGVTSLAEIQKLKKTLDECSVTCKDAV